MFKSISEVKEANKELKVDWFEPEAMRFFKTEVVTGMYFGTFFITTEIDPNDEKSYNVRRVGAIGKIDTVGDFRSATSLAEAEVQMNDYIEDAYLSFFNDYLTVDKFAGDYGVSVGSAYKIIDEGRRLNALNHD